MVDVNDQSQGHSGTSYSARCSIFLGLVLAGTMLGACSPGGDPAPVAELPASSTPAPTATATVPPLLIVDAAAKPRDVAPVPGAGAPCGIVDTLDAPLEPPDGLGSGVRWPYGIKSRRYGGKYHAGEDWGLRGGRNLGKPVYTIGHGQVIYSAPLGWGRDQGVMIVRHAFEDGDTVLSFYGHLDPPSVTLPVGSCVARGAMLARIGNPRTSPHLHFEIRDHMPNEPGPGYWSVDPALAGWHPPSLFIWTQRIRTTPGVAWTRTVTEPLRAALGPAADGTIVIQPDVRRLIGLDAADGTERWTITVARPLADAVLDADGDTLYLLDRLGSVAALALGGTTGDDPAALDGWITARAGRAGAPSVLWADDAGRGASPTIIALPGPGGGVAVQAGEILRGFWPDGRVGWSVAGLPPVDGHALADGWIVLTTPEQSGSVRRETVPAEGPGGGLRIVALPLPGRPAVAGNRAFVLHAEGVWSARLDGPDVVRRHPLPRGVLDEGQILTLADGGALVTHRGVANRRLLRLDASGGLVWDRRIDHVDPRLPSLLRTRGLTGPAPRLVTASSDVLRLDLLTGEATRVFAGGARVSGGRALAPPQALNEGTLLVQLDTGGPEGLLVAIEPEGDVQAE